jgi:hypothetical protein
VVRAGLLDDARPGERRGDVGGAAHDARLSDDRRRVGRAVHAVLQRQHRRFRPRERAQQRQRRRVVVRLHGEQDELARADRGRVGLGTQACDELAARRLHDESPPADGVEVRTARDDGHVVAGAGELRRVVASDRARADDRDSHSSGRPLARVRHT